MNRAGTHTAPCRRAPGYWTTGRPFWLRTPGRAQFAAGHSRTLAYWRSAAVDRRMIPFGSRIFVSVYCDTPARGWLEARDTGGAIIGPHIDVYRPPPATRPAGPHWGALAPRPEDLRRAAGTTAERLPRCG